jgi:hypothetical protein
MKKNLTQKLFSAHNFVSVYLSMCKIEQSYLGMQIHTLFNTTYMYLISHQEIAQADKWIVVNYGVIPKIGNHHWLHSLSVNAHFLVFPLWTVNLTGVFYSERAEWHRVARWFNFKPKIPIWVHIFWRALEWKILVHFMAILSILWPFGTCILWQFT